MSSRPSSKPSVPPAAERGLPVLGPIHVPKTSDVLAERLRTHILDGTIASGAPLPAERDLVLQTGLSRGSVREALRILQTEGLVATVANTISGSKRTSGQSLKKILPSVGEPSSTSAACPV